MNWLFEALRHHPEITFFLTLALGYIIGKIKIGGFTLDAVTGVLIACELVGQIGSSVPWIGFPVAYAISGIMLIVFGYFAMTLSHKLAGH